jgi:hypothetical protein
MIVVLGPVVGLLAAFVHLNLLLGTNAAVNAIGHDRTIRRTCHRPTGTSPVR